jgi:hypothetical protein
MSSLQALSSLTRLRTSYLPRTRCRSLLLALSAVLISCAQGPDEIIDEYIPVIEAGRPPVDSSLTDSSMSIDPPIEEPVVIPEASVPPLDAGVRDAGGGSPESGVLQPVDSGSTTPPDTGAPRDAGLDSTTPVKDAAPDTSTPVDTGTSPEASNGLTCSTTPAYATATACAKCTCMKCAAPVMNCYASSDANKNMQCAAVQACAEQNHCVGAVCLCGEGDPLCLSADGKCRQVIETAAGTSNALDINRMSGDTSTSVGRANAIGDCEMAQCRNECGL